MTESDWSSMQQRLESFDSARPAPVYAMSSMVPFAESIYAELSEVSSLEKRPELLELLVNRYSKLPAVTEHEALKLQKCLLVLYRREMALAQNSTEPN